MVAVQLFSWKPLILPSQALRRDRFVSFNRSLSLHSPLSGIDSSRCQGTFKVKSQKTGDTEPPNLDLLSEFNFKFHKSLPYKFVIGCIPLYAVFIIAQKIFQERLPCLIQNSAGAGLAFACASNSLNKPTPLNLDVALPSFHDIKWGFARFLYLFNIQLEKNIGTFLVALLLACISFVIIGGFLFFQFRHSTLGRMPMGGLGMPHFVFYSSEAKDTH